MTKEKFTIEAFAHLTAHFLGIVLLFWLMVIPTLWISVLILILEVMQMKLIGRCVLTELAHRRGYMRGKTYWQYVSYLFGVKDYKTANAIISRTIELSIVTILVLRLIHFLKLI